MNVLDLFSGIGGFSLGLERAGMRTVAFCEIDDYCRRVLAKHWPTVPVFGDIRELTAERVMADAAWHVRPEQTASGTERQRTGTGRQSIDVICGGFPCQDISHAGKGAGIDGARSGLWSEFARIIGEIRPQYAIVENVAALLGRGIERVLGDLAALGYDAEWHCIPASAVGAPHRRDRVWIVGYPNRDGQSAIAIDDEMAELRGMVADAACGTRQRQASRQDGHPAFSSENVSDAKRDGRETLATRREWPIGSQPLIHGTEWAITPDANGAGREQQRWGVSVRAQLAAAECADWWRIEPDVGRVAHGVPARVHRLRALGNAVVPQIPELIGRAIMAQHNA